MLTRTVTERQLALLEGFVSRSCVCVCVSEWGRPGFSRFPLLSHCEVIRMSNHSLGPRNQYNHYNIVCQPCFSSYKERGREEIHTLKADATLRYFLRASCSCLPRRKKQEVQMKTSAVAVSVCGGRPSWSLFEPTCESWWGVACEGAQPRSESLGGEASPGADSPSLGRCGLPIVRHPLMESGPARGLGQPGKVLGRTQPRDRPRLCCPKPLFTKL